MEHRSSLMNELLIPDCDCFDQKIPFVFQVIVSKALTAISAAGCGISLLALIITVVMHAGLWK